MGQWMVLCAILVLVTWMCEITCDLIKDAVHQHHETKRIIVNANKKETVDHSSLLLEENSYNKLLDLIDSIISIGIETYISLQAFEPDIYFDEGMIKEMESYVLAYVGQHMSEDILYTIGIFCKEDRIDNLVKLRIKLSIATFVAEINKPIE